MFTRQGVAIGAALGAALLAAHPAAAQNSAGVSGQIDALQQQIQALQQQLQALKSQVNESQAAMQKSQAEMKQAQVDAQAQANANAQAAAAAAASSGPKITLSAKNRPGWTSADGQNSIALTTRLHFDAADYLRYRPGTGGANGEPTAINNGVNARRARIGILGKFAGDWNYELTYDLGGTTDTVNSTETKPIASGLNHAYVSYNGFRPVGIDLGYLDVPHTLGESMSSNDILFLERPAIVDVVNGIAAGDARSAFGVHGNTDRAWGGLYLTGPASGANHSDGEQIGGIARATYQVLQNDDYTFHVGVDGQHLFSANRAGGAQTLTLSDQPELRVDPTTFISTFTSTSTTGGLFVKDASTYGGELAGSYKSLYAAGEIYGINVAQDLNPANNTIPTPNLNFWGGYLEGGWTITGEHRKYDRQTGAYGGITPEHPLSLKDGGFGAFEVVARYSYVDLNDLTTFGTKAATTGGTFGGTQTIGSVGLNWYPNSNVRLMFDYIHADIDRQLNTNGKTSIGAKIDAIAMRTQVAF